MFYRHLIAACSTALLLSACAVHPLPENIEGFNTVQIVERIRCEAVKSVQQEVINLLNERGDPLGESLQSNPEQFIKFNPNRLKEPLERYFYFRYIKSAIAYGFTFDISEANAANSQIDLLKAITGGTVSLDLKSSANLQRENSRALVVAETFQHLLDDENVCKDRAVKIERQLPYDPVNHDIPNLAYPVTGSIGLFEVVKTFIDLNEEGLLSPGKSDKAPVLTDTLMFTTTLMGSVTPTVQLDKVMGHNVQLQMATLTNSVMRKDLNTVIVSLSLAPTKGYERAPLIGPFAGAAGGASIFARQTESPAVQRALDALSQQRIDTFYNRFSQAFAP